MGLNLPKDSSHGYKYTNNSIWSDFKGLFVDGDDKWLGVCHIPHSISNYIDLKDESCDEESIEDGGIGILFDVGHEETKSN